jgi:hypothetical protein
MGVEVYLQAKDGGGGARRFRHRESGIEILESRSKVGGAGSSVRFKEQRRILRLGFMSKRGAQSAWIPGLSEICFGLEVRQRVKQIGRLFQIRIGIS